MSSEIRENFFNNLSQIREEKLEENWATAAGMAASAASTAWNAAKGAGRWALKKALGNDEEEDEDKKKPSERSSEEDDESKPRRRREIQDFRGEQDARSKTSAPKGSVGSTADYAYKQNDAALTWGRQQKESTIQTLKAIVENNISQQELAFEDKTITINNRVAKKVVNLYESLNKENKKKLEQSLNEDIVSFRKVINFAIRQ